ncbi:hypothetical protein MAPG_08981 [Magnaporthiopsis poae ATCC 64411]|uniref:Eisosome protein 1 n=1 Tax=Magnaporthiopsis poae (strain ATCC 64411 / 73-15) TaxID=644358 RepID=A0A0C4E8R3_MAGP6|nr:hypothetical protein MAPG_08981 [Magnaporthiopsis poae ATCC 64411]
MQSTRIAAQAPPGPGGTTSSGRLKYAEPRDLPSFPSLGLRQDNTAASAAATLGWATQRPVASPASSPAEPSSGTQQSPSSSTANPTLAHRPKSSGSLASPASAAAQLANKDRRTTRTDDRNDIISRAAVLAAAGGLARSQQDSGSVGSPVTMGSPALSQGPASPSTWGGAAANQAFRANSVRLRAAPSEPSLMTTRSRGSLRAAKDAMAASAAGAGMGRPRAVSSPTEQVHKSGLGISSSPVIGTAPAGEPNTTQNALTAATTAHHGRAASASSGVVGGTGPYTTMDRQMFTSQPPVRLEVDDQKRADVLHASAVAMAKRMYSQQQEKQKMADAAAAKVAEQVDSPHGSPPPKEAPMQFTNLQDAAYKLAQERLSKLQYEHNLSRNYWEYYGGVGASPSHYSYPRFTISGKLRRRSSSDGAVMPVVGFGGFGGAGAESRRERRRRKARSMLADKSGDPAVGDSPGLTYDEKRQRDREALLAAARRNVKLQLEGIDRKVLADSGKVPPSLLGEWEAKAHAAALARTGGGSASASSPPPPPMPGLTVTPKLESNLADIRSGSNAGKIDIGGGKFMDQTEIDEIAARRVQPFLDEINDKAEKEMERLAALRVEEDRKRAEVEGKRAQEREIKENLEKLKGQQKGQEKARREEIRQEERARKQLEKEAKLEQKRLAKEGGRGPKEASAVTGKQSDLARDPESPPLAPSTSAPLVQKRSHELRKKPSRALQSLSLRLPGMLNPNSKDKERSKEKEAEGRPTSAPSASGTSPTTAVAEDSAASPTAKMRMWLKSRFRGRSRSSAEAGSFGADTGKKGSFIGGVALSGAVAGTASSAAQQRRAGSGSSLSSLGAGDQPGTESMRDVALAGRGEQDAGVGGATVSRTTTATSPTAGGAPTAAATGGSVTSLASSNNMSSLSSSSSSGGGGVSGGDNFVLARDHFSPGGGLPLPPVIRDPARTTKAGSPVRDSRFLEMIE